MIWNLIKQLFLSLALLLLVLLAMVIYMTWMPEPDLVDDRSQSNLEVVDLRARLEAHVTELSKYEAGRNYIVDDNLTPPRDYISSQFFNIGLSVEFQNYVLYGDEFSNIIVDIPSVNQSAAVLIVGAHYDSIEKSPGANDNASGVAALIELGRYLAKNPPQNYQVRLVGFANEEPPYFQSEEMGSMVYAKSLFNTKEKVLGMISLETIGYYSDDKGSQKYPKPFNLLYPGTGNFVSFIGNLRSRELVTASISLFRKNSNVPSEGVASPAFIPGIGWSDHWAFWVFGYDAIMVTDTALYRYNPYHRNTDTPDKLSYDQYARVVYGIFKMVEGLANEGL